MPAKSRASPIRSKQRSKDPCAEWKRKLKERDTELREALEEQTATREILRVISSSSTDTQPVFDAVAESAARLCGAHDVVIRLVDGTMSRAVAHHGPIPVNPPRVLTRANMGSRAILDARTVHISDVTEARVQEEYPETWADTGQRTFLAVPLVREGGSVGSIVMRRMEVRPFTDKQIKLLETFADQAVIAIENVRLFKELQARNAEVTEALEQQTATAEILKVISSSPTNLQPVFDAILENAIRLCNAHMGNLSLFDGHKRIPVAQRGGSAEYLNWVAEIGPVQIPLGDGPVARMIAEQRPIQHADLRDSPRYRDRTGPGTVALVELGGARSHVVVPMLKEGRVVGSISIYRPEVRPFTQKQIDLVSTFANQAVIAIDNVRLFNETKEALEQQTATAEILRVISESPTDTQPVFDAIVNSAERLFGGLGVTLRLVKGDQIEAVATTRPGVARTVPLSDDRYASTRAILRREVVHVPDVLVETWFSEEEKRRAEVRGRAIMCAPLLREDRAIGLLRVSRANPGPFSEKEIALLRTFAAQAVIAIENVRLFKELEARNVEVTEALEQQTATAEILRVISSSPTNLQPVFDAILEKATQLCDSHLGLLGLFDGEYHQFVAVRTGNPDVEKWALNRGPFRPQPDGSLSRLLRDGKPYQVADLRETSAYREHRRPMRTHLVEQVGVRSFLSVPMLKDGRAVGEIHVYRAEVRPFTQKEIDLVSTFASQAVIAIENVRLFKELQARNAEISEALQQQTATAEILQVISSSPTDTQPVFDAILEGAARLCDSHLGTIGTYDGEKHQYVAVRTGNAEVEKWVLDREPFRPHSGGFLSKVLESGEPVEIADLKESTGYRDRRPLQTLLVEQIGVRTHLSVPMLKEGRTIGTISIYRVEVRPFTQKEIDLVVTFANQAVIAIENVRLFNETKEALEQQKVISEILQVISSSPTDTQPVFDAIVKSGVQLFGGMTMSLRLIKGDHTEMVAATTPISDDTGGELSVPLADMSFAPTRAIGRREVIQVADFLNAADWVGSLAKKRAELRGFRAIMCAPLLRDGRAIGAVNVDRALPGAFTDKQVALLKTFADQAVIAIENVRLFKELQARNADVTEALEQQTATAGILRVISSSPTDIQPVFDAILENATRLCDAHTGSLRLYEGKRFRGVAQRGIPPEYAKWWTEKGHKYPPNPKGGIGRAVTEQRPIQILDQRESVTYREGNPSTVALVELGGARTHLTVPMLKEGRVMGAIVVHRREVRAFTQKQIDLLSTFADQAVIAIENVRLFKELQAQTEALSRSVGQLTALGEVGQAISSTLDLETVLQTIVSRALQLSGLDSGSIYEYDPQAQVFRLQATDNMPEEITAAVRASPVRAGDGLVGRTAVTHELTQVPDILDASYRSGRRDLLLRAGYRALLAVPLLREEQLLGVLLVSRKTPGAFAPETVDLLKTFATQSALAIQNARLFREIAEKGRQLEVASQHKSQFLASMSHELRTPLNAILGFNEMILDEIYGPVTPDVRSPLEEMQASGKHLLRLINNVLDLAKIEAGRMELSLQDYSVHDTVESVRSTLRSIAAEKELELLTVVPADIPLAHGDPGRMSQCLLNLAGNALKFTKAGKVEIGAMLKGDQLVYRVSDTGIGIPADKIESLFTEFKQTDATIAAEYGGTGLGLSITKKFIEMHGGRIWVESEPGKGSAFIFEVPLRAKST